jgi:hypothetical protein
MKQEIKLIVESTDLPTCEPGFTDQGYLSLNTRTKIVVPNRNVEFLDHLIAAATALAASIRKTQEPLGEFLSTTYQHPGTWLPGDTVEGKYEWTRRSNGDWKREDDSYGFLTDENVGDFLVDPGPAGFRITHLVPRPVTQEPTTQPAELQHPGTWLPGDRVVDWDNEAWTRGRYEWRAERYPSSWRDEYVDGHLRQGRVRITHLVPRSEVA